MKFRDYYQVRDWLESFIPLVYGKEELGLARIEYLLELLGNPEKKLKSIHIAGTSGKGSVAFYIARLLQQCGTLKIGLHVSPHLVDIRERMQILDRVENDNLLVPMDRFIKLISEVAPVVESMKATKVGSPSYFEILVAASFAYFGQERVDWAVVEVGLGGRLDATNVLSPRVSVITNIGLDHREILGKTIEKIAYEKARIINKNVPVVTGTSGRALQVIADVARKRQAPLVKVDTQKNQDSNKFLALAAVRAVGVEVEEKAVEAAFRAKFAGRLEEIDTGVILDGAHNPDKIRFLIDFLRAEREVTAKNILVSRVSSRGARTVTGVTLVLAFKKGKEWKKMIDLLVKNLPIKRVYATQFYAATDMGKYQAVELEEIAGYVRQVYRRPTTVYSNSQEAVFEAINSSVVANTSSSFSVNSVKQSDDKIASSSFDKLRIPRNDKRVILVTGSLYLVGEVRTIWQLPKF